MRAEELIAIVNIQKIVVEKSSGQERIVKTLCASGRGAYPSRRSKSMVMLAPIQCAAILRQV